MAGGEKDGKTEKPTAKKLGEARQKGQIPRSQELVSWIAILAGFSVVESTVRKGAKFMHKEMLEMANLIKAPDEHKALHFMIHSIEQSFVVIAPLIITFLMIGVVGHFAQVRFVFSTKSLKPNLKALNPLAGIKKLFSPQSGFQFIKQFVKLVVFGIVAYMTLHPTFQNLSFGGPYSNDTLVSMTVTAVVRFIKYTAFAGVIIGIVDYLYNRRKIGNDLKMTKQEVKEESRTQDLPPEVKGKIRSKQREMSRNRMMSAIKQADVVIVNPVHIAMALKYDPVRGAPRVVAKGAGFIAERIREKADEERVPIVQDIPLARALHKSCEIDDEIPWQMFESVAKVLAFVYGLRSRGTSVGYHKMPGTPDLEDVELLENAGV